MDTETSLPPDWIERMAPLPVVLLISGAAATALVGALVRRRHVAPLIRGSLERACVAVGAALAAAALSIEASAIDMLLPGSRELLLACAPVAIAAAPWAAGEVLSGPSAFSLDAFAGSVVAAQLASIAAWSVAGASPLAIGAAAAAAAGAYLRVRGDPARPSTIYGS